MTSKQKVSIVTGSSSGMGFETSLILARNGFYTYATMRKLDGEGSKEINDISKKENLPLQVIRLDVNDDKSVHATIQHKVSLCTSRNDNAFFKMSFLLVAFSILGLFYERMR